MKSLHEPHASQVIKTSVLIEQGNLKLDQLYNIIKFSNDKPDFLGIDLYSDIRSWYKSKKTTDENGNITYISKLKSRFYKTSYCYLSKKYRVSKETIRNKLVKLEYLGLLSRAFTTEKRYYEREENNILNILVWKKTPHFESCVGLDKSEDLLDLCYKKIYIPELQPSPNETGDIYSKTNNLPSSNLEKDILDRASESNFIESNSEEGKGNDFSETERSNVIETEQSAKTEASLPAVTNLVEKIKAKFTGNKRKPIAELCPITEDEACNLRSSSQRDFNLNFINKLKEKLGKKYPTHKFYTRAKFLEYLSKALANELHDATVANNESFKFKENNDESHKTNYLKKIEEGRATDRTSQLKRKLACSFDIATSYKILTSCSFKDYIDNNIFEIRISEPIDLSESYYELLLELVQSVYGNRITEVDFILDNNLVTKDKAAQPLTLNLGKEGSIWQKISTKLLNYYGEAVHKSWFSKLEAHIDYKQQKIALQAPTNFIKDWMLSNYKYIIEQFCEEENYSLVGVEVS